MKRALLPIAVLAGLAIAPVTSFAQTPKAGLWETTVQTSGAGMGGAANLPPEAIAKAAAAGVDLSKFNSGGGHTIKAQSCVTADQIAKYKNAVPPSFRPEDQCAVSDFNRSGANYSATVTCNGRFKGTGSFKGGADSDTATHGQIDMTGTATDQQGRSIPLDMHTKFTAAYLGPDCGSVKPAGQ